MTYLKFIKISKDVVEIWNNDSQFLGSLGRIRVGRWMSWCLTHIPSTEIYFSASCLDEIREKVKQLNSKEQKEKLNDL